MQRGDRLYHRLRTATRVRRVFLAQSKTNKMTPNEHYLLRRLALCLLAIGMGAGLCWAATYLFALQIGVCI